MPLYLTIITTSVDRCIPLYYVLTSFFVLYIVVCSMVFMEITLVVGLVVKICDGVESVEVKVLGYIPYAGS